MGLVNFLRKNTNDDEVIVKNSYDNFRRTGIISFKTEYKEEDKKPKNAFGMLYHY